MNNLKMQQSLSRYSLSTFRMWRTYQGILMGDPNFINEKIFHDLKKIEEESRGVEKPVLNLVEPKQVTMEDRMKFHDWQYPEYTCIATFTGPTIQAKIDPDDEFKEDISGSNLVVIWQTDVSPQALNEIAAEILQDIDWDRHAENYGF